MIEAGLDDGTSFNSRFGTARRKRLESVMPKAKTTSPIKKPTWWVLLLIAIVSFSTRYFSIKHNDLFLIVGVLSMAVGLFFGYQGAATKNALFAVSGTLSLCFGVALADYFLCPTTWPWAEEGYELLLIVM